MSETPWTPDEASTWVGGPGLAGSLWRYRRVIVLVAVLAAVVGIAAALLLPPRFEAQANLYLRDPGSPAVQPLDGSIQSQAGDHAIFMATQARLAGSEEVYQRAQDSLGGSGTPDVRSSVAVEPSADLTVLTITGTSSDPVEAANLANAVGAAYQQVARERISGEAEDAITQLRRVTAERNAEFDALRTQAAQASGSTRAAVERKALHVADLISALQVRQDDIAARAAMYGSGIVTFERAAPPASPSGPAPLLLALLGAVVGLIVAGGWAWWAAGRDRRVEAEGDAGAILGVPLLGETPRLSSKLRGARGPQSQQDGPDPVAAEAYHFMLASLEHALSRIGGGKVVAVVSAGQGDGKTVTVLNLALAARREGRRVRLIDADERTRELSQLCRDGEQFTVFGLAGDGEETHAVAVAGASLQDGARERNGRHPAVFFRSTAFGELVNPSNEADLVLIDTPALLGVSEAVTIADKADAVLLVVNCGTSLTDLRRARERLAFTDTPTIGYLLNRGAPRRGDAGYGGTGRGAQYLGRLRRKGADEPPRQPPSD